MTQPLHIRLTRGDASTQPGGIMISATSEGYATHLFNRQPGQRQPLGKFWGHYFSTYGEAFADFAERVNKAKGYDTGGSLIPGPLEEAELAKELERVAA